MQNPTPIDEFDWADNAMEPRTLTCRNHPSARYLTKHPRLRTLHVVGYPDGLARECPCPLSDLVVIHDQP